MATLTSDSTLSVGDASTVTEQIDILISSAPIPGGGQGRLAHPVLGTYDYELAPPEWGNIDSNVVIKPVWASTKTLTATANTLWEGDIKDVEVYERWTGSTAMHAPQLRMFIDMWTTPPTPDDYVVWTPNYLNSHSYKVIITSVSCGGSQGINLDFTSLQGDGFVKGPAQLNMRVVEQVT